MHSHFSSQTLAEIFRDLYLGERSGVLELEREEEKKRIWFSRGLIHFAESDEDYESVGRHLVHEKLLSAGALNEAEGGNATGVELAQVLLNRGLIARERVTQATKAIIDSVVRSVFLWQGGEARFTDDGEDAAPEAVLETDVLATFEVILQGIFTMSDFDPIGEAMRGLDNTLRLRSPAPLPVERLKLSPSHGFILSRVDERSAVAEVLSVLPQHEEALALRFLFGLLVMGVLEYEPSLSDGPFRVANILRDHADRRALERMQEQTIRQAYAQMRTQNPYEVLGVTPSASRDAVEQAYEETKGLFSRDRLLPRVRDRFRSELAVIESRLIEAYLRLTQADTAEATSKLARASGGEHVTADDLLVRVEMDKTRSKVALEESKKVAAGYFSKAQKAQREGDFHNAIQYGKLAVSYDPTDARLFFLLAECQVRNPGPRWQHDAEQNFTKATELDPWNAGYWISLGRFYKKRGLKLRARKQFEEALKLVPEHDEATSELAALGK